jgi:sugar phosphate isomerase/epimerase
VAATIGPIVEARADAGPNGAREALAALARIGCPCVQWSVTTPGLRPRELDGTARRGILTELKRLELRCSGVDAWIPPGHLLDRSTIDRAIGAIEQAILLASDLAGTSDRMRPVVAVLVPTEREAGEGTAASELNQAIGALAARAERAGVVLADHAGGGLGCGTRSGRSDHRRRAAARQRPTRRLLPQRLARSGA